MPVLLAFVVAALVVVSPAMVSAACHHAVGIGASSSTARPSGQ
ncbi:hypothetical protein [Cyanobium usitatum]|nr:hypothetical protein [Cyanobium usitatum]